MADILHYGDVLNAAAGQVPNIYDIFNKERAFALERQQQSLQTQQEQRLQAAQAQKQAQQLGFAHDLAEYQANPSAQSFGNLAMKYPDWAEGLAKGYGVQDAAQKADAFKRISGLWMKVQNGDPEGAAADLRAQIASRPPEQDDGGVDAGFAQELESKDPTRIKAAGAHLFANAFAAAGDQKSFLEAAKDVYPNKHIHWDNGLAYDEDTMQLIGQAPEGGRNQLMPDGTLKPLPLIPGVPVFTMNGVSAPAVAEGPPNGPTPGGTPVPGVPGAPAGARRVNGWSPRISNGGDNPDKAIDNKLGVISKTTGWGLDQPLGVQDVPRLFDALTGTEKVRAAYNNPGGIKDGSWARAQPGYVGSSNGLARFNSTQTGRNAGIKLMTQHYQAGHHTIRDMVEGRLAGADDVAAAPQTVVSVRSQQQYANLPTGAPYRAPGDPPGKVRYKGKG